MPELRTAPGSAAPPEPAPGELTPLPLPIQPAPAEVVSPVSAPPIVPLRRSRARFWLAASALAAMGALGGGVASWRRGAAAPSAVAPAASPIVVPHTPMPVPARPPPLDRGRVLGDARTALAAAMADPSPRVRLLAATALSRTGDRPALDALADALVHDASEIRRLEFAFALGRAGDARGTEYLAASLRASRRDVRLEAARALARLGDARGHDRLTEALDAVQLRLGAAENLATLGDARGIAVLRDALAGREPEPRLRAAVALGRAGDATGKEILLGIIDDGRLEIGAGDALARLGDHAAVPALERALGLGALRVQAAVALRRLGVDPAQGSELAVLDRALAGSDVVGKITAAEAALVLLLPAPPPELR